METSFRQYISNVNALNRSFRNFGKRLKSKSLDNVAWLLGKDRIFLPVSKNVKFDQSHPLSSNSWLQQRILQDGLQAIFLFLSPSYSQLMLGKSMEETQGVKQNQHQGVYFFLYHNSTSNYRHPIFALSQERVHKTDALKCFSKTLTRAIHPGVFSRMKACIE